MQVSELSIPAITAMDIVPLGDPSIFLKVFLNPIPLMIFIVLSDFFYQLLDNAFQWAATVAAASLLAKEMLTTQYGEDRLSIHASMYHTIISIEF